EDGFCHLPDFFPLDEIQQIYDDEMELFAYQLRRHGIPEADWRDPAGLSSNLRALFNTDMEAYLGAARQSQLLPSIHNLTTSPKVVETLRSLGLEAPVVSTKPVCHYTTEALTIPGGYNRTPPHQDWRSMQGSLDGVVLWIPLIDIDELSYPVEIIPGSHKLGLAKTVPHVSTPMVMDERVNNDDFVPAYPKRGDLVILSGFLVHRTSDAGDERVRVAMSLRYNNAAEPAYIEHAFPTPYTYSYQLELLFENFPAKNQVRDMFSALAS
ncbi:MAG: hypothetical protein HOF33_01420, partial [Rhodospirillaceae bacterium]|nr:hypothetical protein [Rhodospirillaceae bacterium]